MARGERPRLLLLMSIETGRERSPEGMRCCCCCVLGDPRAPAPVQLPSRIVAALAYQRSRSRVRLALSLAR